LLLLPFDHSGFNPDYTYGRVELKGDFHKRRLIPPKKFPSHSWEKIFAAENISLCVMENSAKY